MTAKYKRYDLATIARRVTLAGFPGLLTTVARQTGFSLSYVSYVYHGKRRSEVIDAAIRRGMREAKK